MHCLTAIAASAIFVGSAAGCMSSPAARFYTLSATSAPALARSELSVAVGPVTVPAVVDRPQIVVDTGPNQVRLEDFNRWAAPLQNNIARVIADNLVQLLGTPRVISAVQTSSVDADYRAAVDVQSFQSIPGEAAILDAVWTVRRTKDGKVETGRTTVREALQANDFAALAAGHSRALSRVSVDIANAVRSLATAGR